MMRRSLCSVVACSFLLWASPASALDQGRYSLTDIHRDGMGEYKARCGSAEVRIKTSFCNDMTFNAKGILVWAGSYGSKLVIFDTFDEDKRVVCEVTEVWLKQ